MRKRLSFFSIFIPFHHSVRFAINKTRKTRKKFKAEKTFSHVSFLHFFSFRWVTISWLSKILYLYPELKEENMYKKSGPASNICRCKIGLIKNRSKDVWNPQFCSHKKCLEKREEYYRHLCMMIFGFLGICCTSTLFTAVKYLVWEASVFLILLFLFLWVAMGGIAFC